MSKFNGLKLAGPVLAVILAGGLAQGCGSEDDPLGVGGSCEGELGAKLDAVGGSVDALIAVSATMKGELAVACATIANDLEAEDVPDVGDGSDVSDDDLRDACAAASGAIDAEIAASGSISVVVEGGKCEVNAEAQFSCEADCSVEGECDPGSIEVRCDPGELSVQCEGSCEGNATCEGTAEVAANCEGLCEGSCTGECSGTCTGTCDGDCSAEITNAEGEAECAGTCDGECQGSCDASCTGTCSGSCTLEADASIECGADVKCKGGCDGDFTAPSCEGDVEPPQCELDAECEAGCEGQGKFEAECTPPGITINGEGSAELVATLEANLPVVLKVLEQSQLAAETAVDIAGNVGTVVAEISDDVACAASGAFIELSGQVSGAVDAAASVSVSVEASAEVSGSASAG